MAVGLQNFKPVLWSARLLANIDNKHVYGNLVNRDYEGQIKQRGDKVRVFSIGDVTIKDYLIDTDIDKAERLETTSTEMVIDQQKYFHFGIDDIDKAQINMPIMNEYTQKAGYAMSGVIDSFIANIMVTGGTGVVGAAADNALNAGNIYEYFVKAKLAMDKVNMSESGRYAVVPPEVEALLLLEPRFVATGGSKAEGIIVNGFIGRVAGIDIYVSNLVPNTAGAKYKIVFTNRQSTSYAKQITEMKAYEPEKQFGQNIKGLTVFGAKVFRPRELFVLTASFADLTPSA